jgi:hypothetical protein
MIDYLERILLARVYDVAIESPLDTATNLSRRVGNTILLSGRTCNRCFPSSYAALTTRWLV